MIQRSENQAGPRGLKQLYGTKGYIDFVAAAATEIDDANQRISLHLELDQQKQFRVGKIKVLSTDPATQTQRHTERHSGREQKRSNGYC